MIDLRTSRIVESVTEWQPQHRRAGRCSENRVHACRLGALSVVALSIFLAMAARSNADIVLNEFANPHPLLSQGPIGFAFAGDKFVGSVLGDGTGLLYSTDLTGGNVQLFAPAVNIPASPSGEHFVASSLGLGGFPNRDIYVAAGDGIVHIAGDASSSDAFVTNLSGNVRGILFDAVGTFDHDMLVTTDTGNIYRVDSSGSAGTPLASVIEDTEGLDVAPIGAGFGAYDGQLIVASEASARIRAIIERCIKNATIRPKKGPGRRA